MKMTGDMSVDDLIAQYTDKLRFAGQWIVEEHDKVHHFVEMLPADYRTMPRMATTLQQAFTLARMAERDVKVAIQERRERSNQGRQGSHQSSQQPGQSNRRNNRGNSRNQSQTNSRVSGSVNSGKKEWCGDCKNFHTGECTIQTRKCKRCGTTGHLEEGCTYAKDVCWNCKKEGHRSINCPTGRKAGNAGASSSGARGGSVVASSSPGQKRKNPPAPEARAFQMTADAATANNEVITGMFLVNSIPARVLFDSWANHSYMSLALCDKLNLASSAIVPMSVEVGDGRVVSVTSSVSGATVEIDKRKFPIYCLLMPLGCFDLVLGMGWLNENKALIDCDKKIIKFNLPDGTKAVARGEQGGFSCPLMTMMKASRMLSKGCESFFAYVIDAKGEKKALTDIPIVSEFAEVFPDELPGLPPIREVEYKIDLLPGATPV